MGCGRSIILISMDKQKALVELAISLDTGLLNAYSIEKEWKKGMKEGERKRGREEGRKEEGEREREIEK